MKGKRGEEIRICAQRFHLLFTHDLHSHFDNWPYVVSEIKQLQQQFDARNESYLLLDIGDHADRFHYITEGTVGKANVDLLNQLGYDYITIGNNEGITFDKQQLNELYQQADFSILVNNLFNMDGERPPWVRPYEIVYMAGYRLGLIGTTVDFQPFYSMLGWKVTEPVQTVANSVEMLREKCDMIVLLSHLGLRRDQYLAETVPDIDVILGAHTHHVLPEGLKKGHTWIHQVGKFGHHVGCMTVEVSPRGSMNVEPQTIPVGHEVADQSTQQALDVWHNRALKELNEPVLHTEMSLSIDWHEESLLGNLLAQSLRDWCETEIAMVNAGQILEPLPPGDVTKGDIHRICPHPINPCRIVLTGAQIEAILQRFLERDFQNVEIKGFGFRGKKLGMLCIDGMEVTCRKQDSGVSIVSIRIGDEWLQAQSTYSVATVDMFTFGQIIPEIAEQKEVHFYLPEFLRDVLAERLRKVEWERLQLNHWKYMTEIKGE